MSIIGKLVVYFCALFTGMTNIPNFPNSYAENNTEFTFNTYKTAEEARTALLHLHPIGSSTQALLNRLEKLGTPNPNGYSGATYNYRKKTDTEIVFHYIEKSKNVISLVIVEWNVNIANQDDRIRAVEIKRELTGL